MSIKRSAVYLKAAERIDERGYAGPYLFAAMHEATNRQYDRLHADVAALYPVEGARRLQTAALPVRVLALLFMHHVAKDEERA